MMMKEKSHPWARLKYLYVLPLAAISMVAFAHTEAANNSNGISEAKGTEVSANNQTSSVKSSENEGKVLIVVDGELATIQDSKKNDYTEENLAELGGIAPEEIAHIEVIKNTEALAKLSSKWDVGTAEVIGAILLTTKKAESKDNEEGFMIVEEMPEYPGGMGEMMKFLSRHIKYPAEAKQKGEQGRVVVSFIVGKDGKLRDFEVKRSVSPALDAEAIRVVKEMPAWKPGRQRGKAVDCRFTLPVSFSLQGAEADKEGANVIQAVAYSEDLHGPKKAPACIVLVDSKGGYQYGAEGAMKEGSLEEVANYVNDRRKESNSAGNGAHFKVQLVADEDAPQESVDKLKEALRKIYVLQINYRKEGANNKGDSDEVFQVVEKMPQFPGGMGELMNS